MCVYSGVSIYVCDSVTKLMKLGFNELHKHFNRTQIKSGVAVILI
jgi:hypothetical protein